MTHTVEIQLLRSGGWGATCTCGWVPPISPARDDVVRSARSHAEVVTIVDSPRDEPAEHVAPEPGTNLGHVPRRHERLRAELIREPGNTLRFRSVCSCGWKSEPVTMGRVVVVWDQHLDDADGR